jgi:hypothetical protein
MDLPTCPACKQSVLDDDAVECPFCGAPMKGGAAPARAPAPAKPAAAAKAAAKPQVKGAGGAVVSGTTKSRPEIASANKESSALEAPADDDPFAVDQSAATSAFPVSPQRGAGRSLEVVCPMCETKGWVSPRAAGKLVKCCNPKCMVPIFTAPAAEKKEPVAAPPPAPKKSLPWLYIVGGAAGVLVAAVCAYILLVGLGPQEIPPPTVGGGTVPPTKIGGSQLDEQVGQNGDTGKEANDKGKEKEEPAAVDPATKARDELIAQLLRRMRELSSKLRQQDKAAWQRLAATAYIAGGDQKRFREELDLLKRSKQAYEALTPVTALAWREWSRAPDEFKKAVAEGEALAAKLPTRGRFATEAAAAFAPVLVVSKKTDDGRQLIAAHRSKDADIEQLAAALGVVVNDKSFDLDRTLPGRTVGDWQAPLDTAVVLMLAARGRWDEARAWAAGSSDAEAKTEAPLVWAESFARHLAADDAEGFQRAREVAKELPPEGAARLLARLGDVKVSAGDRAGAEELLGEALSELGKLPVPQPLKVRNYKPLLDLKLPDAAALWGQARAATDVAGLQAKLGQTGKAWESVLLAMQFLSAVAPSWSSLQERMDDIRQSSDLVLKNMAAEMSLKGNDRQIRYNQYKVKLDKQIEPASRQRLQWEAEVLEAAADFGLLDQVWDELQVLDRKSDIHERQPLITTSVPLLVGTRFGEKGNEKRRKEIVDAALERVNPADPKVVMRVTEYLLKTGDVAGCLERLKAIMNPEGLMHEWALRLGCRLVNGGNYEQAVEFCRGLPDVLRSDAFFLVAALAGRSGHAQEFWEAASSGLGAMDASAACAGLVVGMKSEQPKKR